MHVTRGAVVGDNRHYHNQSDPDPHGITSDSSILASDPLE